MTDMSPLERIKAGIDADDRARQAEPAAVVASEAAELAELLRDAGLSQLPSDALDEPFGVERLRRAIPKGDQ